MGTYAYTEYKNSDAHKLHFSGYCTPITVRKLIIAISEHQYNANGILKDFSSKQATDIEVSIYCCNKADLVSPVTFL
jgi:hypothetical protein